MIDIIQCEYCNRPIKDSPVKKTLRGKEHIFCSEFCFRLHFYDVPTISYDDLQKMYAYYCVSIPAQDYRKTLSGLMGEED
jgi:YHS domain-containing protein